MINWSCAPFMLSRAQSFVAPMSSTRKNTLDLSFVFWQTMILPNLGRLAKLVTLDSFGTLLWSFSLFNIYCLFEKTKSKNKLKASLGPTVRLNRITFLSQPLLKRLAEGLRPSKRSGEDELYKLFTNVVCLDLPKVTFSDIIVGKNSLFRNSDLLHDH